LSLARAIEEVVADLIQALPNEAGAELTITVTLPSQQVALEADFGDKGFHTEYVVDDDDQKDAAIGAVNGEQERPQPNLGCASTDELLAEVATRMQVTQNSISGRKLGTLCEEARVQLSPGVLAYRTVNS
jgi:hypothetical protein